MGCGRDDNGGNDDGDDDGNDDGNDDHDDDDGDDGGTSPSDSICCFCLSLNCSRAAFTRISRS